MKSVANASLSEKWKDKKPEIHVSPKIDKLYFTALVKRFHEIIDTFPDVRIGKNVRLSLKDAVMGALAVFFTQTPSFRSYQIRMQLGENKNNAQSIFGIDEIISDSHIRRLLDHVPCSFTYPMFWVIFNGLLAEGYLSQFRSYYGNLLVALDATEYFSSGKIHCKNCSKKKYPDGSIIYSHSVITPVVVNPNLKKAISLIPEFIIPQDGHIKQDCENAAGKRWINAYGSFLKELRVTILGDDLYCRQPVCEVILAEGLDFILTCKESSHSNLYEYITWLKEDIQTMVVPRWEGEEQYLDTYRFLNGVPLRNGKDALEVNWCELTTTRVDDHGGTVVYTNAFATNFWITKENVRQIVADGRTRWKIENENNNVLKTKGYNLEHNFGHGKTNLSSILMALNLLAFLCHTGFDLFDDKYRLIRETIATRKDFFQEVRVLTKYMYFKNWSHLINVMSKNQKKKPRAPDECG